jgi:DNA-directed RNA polymerase specialized sigma54-like protein
LDRGRIVPVEADYRESDHEGFLVDLSDMVKTLTLLLNLLAHLQLVQSSNPRIAARSLEECLQIQLRQRYSNHPVYQTIAALHLNDVARRDAKSLARKLDIPVNTAEDAIQAITHLDPRPARNFAETKHLQMVPDAQIHFKNGSQTDFDIEIFKEYLPRFRISPEYRRMMRDTQVDAATKNYIKSKIGDGSQLMKALELRVHVAAHLRRNCQTCRFFCAWFLALKPRLKDLWIANASLDNRRSHSRKVRQAARHIALKSFSLNALKPAVTVKTNLREHHLAHSKPDLLKIPPAR